ncbi:MAG: dihydroorotate dehydrogenase [Archaeoglobaceae archaeon]|nr:dihydroorotate dehydrogenase [Archaeoglobaceae archaeon]MCX8152439.1 dihydroorotate dehydrogenase [Archaeoglobaceae archaeon]MDW8013779.1 dihydroorotate dehydrogenase [Archaeoglobaceae archaeon]
MLEVEVANLKLKNPLILASGILGSSVSTLNRLSEDFGAVVTKSVGLKEREGYKNPTVINLSCGLLNAVGLASPSAEKFADELKKFNRKCKLIVSLYGNSPEEFEKLVTTFEVDAFEINLSCPHVKGLGLDVGSDVELSSKIIKIAKRSTDKPVFAKISIFHSLELVKKLENAEVDAITVSNTLPAMKIDILSKKPILSNVFGGLSGKAIKPIALKKVYDLYEILEVPIIGCGGVTTFEDVLEFAMAGATAVQIGSVMYYSLDSAKIIVKGLEAFLRSKRCKYRDLIGSAHISTG